MSFTPAQKRAYAIAMSKKRQVKRSIPRSPYVSGRGNYNSNMSYRVVPATRRRRRVATTSAVRGRGDYRSSIGAQIGSAVGGVLGYGAQHLIKYVTGFGDYQITSNSLMGGLYDPPEIKNLKERCVVVRHREYLQDIVASQDFTNYSFPINPGLSTTFPWLSQVAEAFEEYYVSGMIFEFKTLSADYTSASSAALGYVVMATQYNVLNPQFPDKITMENYEFANSAKPSVSFIHPIECKKSVTPVSELYVRTGAIPASADQRLYDLGLFQIATGGNTGSGIIGELWVTFEVILCKPKLASGYTEQADHFNLSLANISNTNAFGVVLANSPYAPVAGSSIHCFISSSNANWLQFPYDVLTGNYMIWIAWYGTAAACVLPTISSVVNLSPLLLLNDDSNSFVSNSGTTTGVAWMCMTYYVNIITPASNPIIKFTEPGGMTLPTALTGAEIWVIRLSEAILT